MGRDPVAGEQLTRKDTLVFVYNAPDGVAAALLDAVHKLASPATYRCSLCSVTYGAVAMKRKWRAWLRRLPVATRFLHRDGFRRAWPALDLPLPVVLLARGDEAPRVVLDAAMLNAQTDVNMLIATLERALGLERAIGPS